MRIQSYKEVDLKIYREELIAQLIFRISTRPIGVPDAFVPPPIRPQPQPPQQPPQPPQQHWDFAEPVDISDDENVRTGG